MGIRRILTCCVAILATGGCGLFHDSTAPTSNDTPTEVFTGTLQPQKSNTFAFTVTTAGSVSVTLTALSPSSIANVGLGIGTSGTTGACTLTSSTANAVAASTAQITVTENPGNYCVEIFDAGTVTTPATFTIDVTHS